MKLTVKYLLSEDDDRRYAFALRAIVEEAQNIPGEIFMYQAGAGAPPTTDDTPTDVFIGIADPVDIEDIPIDEPDLNNEIPFYRTNSVDLIFKSSIERLETLELMKADIKEYVNSMKAILEFNEEEIIEYE